MKNVLNRNEWSVEEEIFIITSREKDVPWKEIAAKLGRTKTSCTQHLSNMRRGLIPMPDTVSKKSQSKFSITIEFTNEQLIKLGKKAAAKLVEDFVNQINNL